MNEKLSLSSIVSKVILLTSALFFSYFILTMEWVSGGADSYSHFLISRYSFQHPGLFLSHWGKPFFVLLSSPFAQFGIKGIEFFNLACMLGAGYLAILVSKKLGYHQTWIAALLVLFSPVVFIHIFSATTEPLSALLTILGIYFLSERKYHRGALAFSFLLFVRNETIIFLPLVALFLILEKQPKAIVSLCTSVVLYSIVGSFYYGSLLWIVEEFPYSGAEEIYASGSLFSFLDSYQSITHLAVGIAFAIGLIAMVYDWIKSNQFLNKTNQKLELLLVLLTIGYFAAHSVVWWLGIGGSLGLKRVMVLIIPMIGVLGIKGLNTIVAVLPSKLKIIFYVTVSVVVVYIPLEKYELPISLNNETLSVKRITDEIVLGSKSAKVGYFHPLVPYFAQLDPFEKNVMDLITLGFSGTSDFKSGDVVIWDSHFGNKEGQIELNALKGFSEKVDPIQSENFKIHLLEKN